MDLLIALYRSSSGQLVLCRYFKRCCETSSLDNYIPLVPIQTYLYDSKDGGSRTGYEFIHACMSAVLLHEKWGINLRCSDNVMFGVYRIDITNLSLPWHSTILHALALLRDRKLPTMIAVG